MKKTYIFDTISSFPSNIETDTLTTVENFNTENVRDMVFAEIHSKKNSKRKFTKKSLSIILVATFALAVIGTVGVGAMGGFNEIFSEHMAGTKVDGFYSGANVNISINQDYDAKLLGIAGDKNNIMSCVEFKNADGTPFTEYNDLENIYVTANHSNEFINLGVVDGVTYENSNNNNNTNINVTTSAWNEMLMNINNQTSFDTSYADFSLTDNGTIKGTYFLNREVDNENNCTLSGETMSISHEYLYIYHDEQLIYEDTVNISLNNSDYSKNFTEADKKAKEAVNKIKDTLTDGQIIRRSLSRTYEFTNDIDHKYVKLRFYISTCKKIKVDFDASWKLNYKYENDITLNATDKTLTFENIELKVNSVKASPFRTVATISTNEDLTKFEENSVFKNLWIDKFENANVIITLENEEKITGILNVQYPYNYNQNGAELEIQILYAKYDSNSDYSDVWIYVSPEQIKSINISGQEFLLNN